MEVADPPDRARLKATCDQHVIVMVLLIMLCWAAVSLALHKRWPNTPSAPLWSLALPTNLLMVGGVVGRLIAYFGLPLSFTLGYRVEPVLPATCEASLPILGPDGWPCSLKRFIQWARGKSGWRLADLEWQCISNGVFIAFLVTLAIRSVVVALPITWDVKRQEREKEHRFLEVEKGMSGREKC